MVFYVLALTLHSNGSYEDVMRSLLAGMEWVTGRFRAWTMPTKAAIDKSRTLAGSEVMVDLFAAAVKPLAVKPFAVLRGAGFYKEWRLASVDGSTLDLADTPANEQVYGRPWTKTNFKSAFPQRRGLGLVKRGTYAVFSAVVQLPHQRTRPVSSLFGRSGVATGAALLLRMKANSALPSLEDYSDGSYLSTVYPSPKDRRKDKGGIWMRVVEHEVTTGEDVSRFLLITSILDPIAAADPDLANLYARRWEIESSFAELKTHQRGRDVVLRSKKPAGVLQEIYGCFCAHYAIRSLIGTVAADFDEEPFGISFTRTIRGARRSIARRRLVFPQKLAEAFTVFGQEILQELLPPRRNRTVPAPSNVKCPAGHSSEYAET